MSAVSDIPRISISVKVVYLSYSCRQPHQLSLDYFHENSYFLFAVTKARRLGIFL
uniref:Uncharacterized protein n=1 Tax=Picea sitchensis TaxID=3332 RepID=D5AEG6_PICSI|nr:unknown [Picea sitchensis]